MLTPHERLWLETFLEALAAYKRLKYRNRDAAVRTYRSIHAQSLLYLSPGEMIPVFKLIHAQEGGTFEERSRQLLSQTEPKEVSVHGTS